jgi:hypothetical protein
MIRQLLKRIFSKKITPAGTTMLLKDVPSGARVKVIEMSIYDAHIIDKDVIEGCIGVVIRGRINIGGCYRVLLNDTKVEILP